jgi:hypothetical protein
MTDYKQAGDLVPDDLYVQRYPGTRDNKIYRVITTRPGNAATVVEVIVESTKTGKRSASNFFLSNRVEIYSAHARTRKSAGSMTRKLSVTWSQ